ncbi:MAG: crotonase/enoyl-CoA hydratase family protein [Acidimicrobiales bacterium]|nr:crotonase/enoyl-CoA hydratase family protein [Acidimicrobiales bacterium]
MTNPVHYEFADAVATITMDDGKVNALSLEMLAAVDGALDHALADEAVVVLRGREGVFSAGFDLGVLRGGGPDAVPMLQAGFRLAERMLSFPAPVVIACPGHAIAMGSFLLLSADYRIGVSGPFRVTANEVAIGLTMPRAAVEICRQRLAPAAFNRAVLLAEVFDPEAALDAGFLDHVVPPDQLDGAVRDTVGRIVSLDMAAHRGTKARVRADFLPSLRRAIEEDDAELAGLTG